jgi:AcrR family transcriptional regulator
MGKGAQTREAILDEAVQLASVAGLEGLTIGTLAHAVGLSKSGLFAHFRSKEQLQLAVLEHAVARFIEVVVAPALRSPRGEARLRALFEGWLSWERDVLRGGCVIQAGADEFDDRPGPVHDYLASNQRDLLDTLTEIVRAGAEVGAFSTGRDPRSTAFEVVGLLVAYHRAPTTGGTWVRPPAPSPPPPSRRSWNAAKASKRRERAWSRWSVSSAARPPCTSTLPGLRVREILAACLHTEAPD